MGTGKSGRYLNTQGAKNSLSEYAVVHSNEGTFIHDLKNRVLRLKSGGHGEDNIKLLNKYNIEYNVNKTYDNGVRVGNIPNHKDPKKRIGNNQSWFPNNWKEKDIKNAGNYVAKLKKNSNAKDGEKMYGTFKGVKIVVIKSHIDNGYYTGYKGAITFTEFYNTTKAIDITASGDVFNGGFLYALTNHYTPLEATKFAAVVSGLQTQNYGAIQAIPYKETVLENLI